MLDVCVLIPLSRHCERTKQSRSSSVTIPQKTSRKEQWRRNEDHRLPVPFFVAFARDMLSTISSCLRPVVIYFLRLRTSLPVN